MRFLHDGKVCGEIGIKYLVKAQTAQSRGHLAFHICADRQTEFLAQSRAYSGSCLNDYMLLRVRNGSEYVCCIILLGQCSGWTYRDALSAGYTGGFSQTHLKGRANGGRETTVVGSDDADALYIFTDSHTAAAEDTFAVVTDHVGGRGINLGRGNLAVVISFVVHAQLVGQLLKLAVSAADTGQTGTVVVG